MNVLIFAMSYTCFEAGGSFSRRQIIPCWFILYNYITMHAAKKHKIPNFKFRAMSENKHRRRANSWNENYTIIS